MARSLFARDDRIAEFPRENSLRDFPANAYFPFPATTKPQQDGEEPTGAKRRFRTVWISDIHLGTRGCNAEFLLSFLKYTECDMLYLVGDIVDGWALKRSWYWKQSHNDVVQKILRST